MFVRIKKIKGKPYAYLVENEWTPWGSRQKVTKYLGRAHILERQKKQEFDLPEGYYNTVREALKQELLNHGFEENRGKHILGEVEVDLDTETVKKSGKDVVIGMNEGFLCAPTLKELMGFEGEEHKERSARKLATMALEAGLNLSPEQMLKLFEEAHK